MRATRDKKFMRLLLGTAALAIAPLAFVDTPFRVGPDVAWGYSFEKGSIWSAAASTCTPDPASISDVTFNASSASFRSGSSATVAQLRCSVLNVLDDGGRYPWDTLEATFADPDGTGTASRVSFKLFRITDAGKSVQIAEINSNGTPAAGSIKQAYASIPGTYFEMGTGVFFVEITLFRTNTSSYPRAFHVRLGRQSP